MNYYYHHIGDFYLATRHLNRIERSIYRDLIELYYDKECPLTDDIEALCRKVMANTEEECVAVQSVLNEFFILKNDLYHNNRCDKEISEYHAKAATARNNGKKGGRPKTKQNPNKTQSVNLVNPEETGSKANQEPVTNNQEPIKKKGTKRFKPPSYSDVIEYINEKKYSVNASTFINHYECNGWMVGRNKMKDWKAAVRQRHSRNKEKTNEENMRPSTSRAKRVVDELDKLAAEDIAENGYAHTLD